jgi:uncharacterized protein (TIGR03545 family)
MIRWKYVIPRLVLLAALVSGIVWGTEPLLSWGLQRSLQQLAGAQVQIAALRADLLHGSLELDELTVGNRNSEFRNLVEVERAKFDVEMYAALRRKLVVGTGQLDGLRFHTKRQASGRLPDADEADQQSSAFSVSAKLSEAGQQGKAWFHEQVGDYRQQLENDLETVRLGRELAERWPGAYRDVEQRATQIEQRAKQLRDQVKQVSDDPLKHLDQLQPLLESVDQLRRELVDARTRLSELQRQMRDDQRQLVAAKEHDTQYVRERLRLDELDGHSLTEYLLGPVWSQRIEMAASWLQRSREWMPPSPETPAAEPASRGVRVNFPGFASSPDVLVRQLQLNGAGTVDQHPFTFSGVVRDLTHQPRRHDQPTTIEIKSEGAIQVIAQATLDRRDSEAVDRLVINIPALRQHQRSLGDATKLAVAMTPGTAKIHADVVLRGERLEGRISMQQDQMQLTPTLGPKYAELISPDNLAAAFQGVDRLDAEVTLSGTLRAPKYDLQSNLGPQLAVGLNQAVRQELQQREQQLLARANREVEQQVAKLEAELLSKQGKLLQRLEIGDEQLGELKKLLFAQVGRPEELISRGRKLLFK